MNADDLREQLRTGLAPLTPTPGSAALLRSAGDRRRRARRTALAAVALVAAGGSALALQPGTRPGQPARLTPDTPAPSPSVQAQTPQTAWQTYLSDHPGPHSGVLTVSSVSWGATATGPTVHVLRYDGTSWQQEAAVALPDRLAVTGLSLATLTSGAAPDVVAQGAGGSAVVTSVISSAGQGWHLDAFTGRSGPVLGVPFGEVVAGSFRSTRNPCAPDCAEASPRTLTWSWTGSAFVPYAGSGICAATSTAQVWSVSGARPSGADVELDYRQVVVHCGGPDDVSYEPVGRVRQVAVPAGTPVDLVAFTASGVSTRRGTAADLSRGGPRVVEVHRTGGSLTSLSELYHP